jgi:DNA-binding NarL/FixJ family response regulator
MIQSAKNARLRRWEPDEDKQLREMVEAGTSVTMIALRLKRTVSAVRSRLTALGITVRRVYIKKNPPA